MVDKHPLNSLFDQYRFGILEKKELEGKIFQFVLKHPKRFHLRQRERGERIDFLCWLYPRISRAVDNYRDTGATFAAYIGAMIFWSSREYQIRERDHRLSEQACWNADSGDDMVRSPEPEYLAYWEQDFEQSAEEPIPKPVSNPRQILVLLLKSYYFISDDFISRIAPALGIEKDRIKDMINELRKLRLKREAEIQGLQQRIQYQFFRCITFEKRAGASPPDSTYHQRMLSRLERARKRLDSMRKRLKSTRFDASNRQVAEVLGISKGTVDSNLHAAREKYGPLTRKPNYHAFSGRLRDGVPVPRKL
jgi:biotin operon repressor